MNNYITIKLSDSDIASSFLVSEYCNPLVFSDGAIVQSPILSWLHKYKILVNVSQGWVIDINRAVCKNGKVDVWIEDDYG